MVSPDIESDILSEMGGRMCNSIINSVWKEENGVPSRILLLPLNIQQHTLKFIIEISAVRNYSQLNGTYNNL